MDNNNLDRFNKVWEKIMAYFQQVMDILKNLFGKKDDTDNG